jgi:biotin operon repressor
MQSKAILLEFIKACCKGRENAMTGERLASYFGGDKRGIQQEIQRLRNDGYPIVSSDREGQKGYFYPASPEEAKEAQTYLRSMRNRALQTLKTVQNIQQGLDKEFGSQMEIEELKEAS